MALRVQIRGKSAADMASDNPVLLLRELGVETDTGRMKIGDGTTAWNGLTYSLGTASWLSGAVDPTTEGINNDYYLNTVSYDVFKKVAGSWGTAIANLKGVTGEAGTDGTDGVDGSTLLSGAVDPATEGADGDFYINTASYDIFKKISGSWGTAIMNLKGAKGDTGYGGAESASDLPITDTAGHFTAIDVEGALAELFTYANDGKGLIATAIIGKGGAASSGDTFTELASAITDIQTGGSSLSPILHLDGIDNTGAGHSASAITWKDLSGTVSDAVKQAGTTSWGENYLLLDGASYWNVNAPNLSRGTVEVVVSIDTDFMPVNTGAWYDASCIFGCELGGPQRDMGILINSAGNFAIGHSNDTIYSSTINALDGLPHTLSYSYFNGPIQFAIDGVVITTFNIGCAGSEPTVYGIGWNKNGAGSKVKGKIYSVKWYRELLTSAQVLSNHNANEAYYGF